MPQPNTLTPGQRSLPDARPRRAMARRERLRPPTWVRTRRSSPFDLFACMHLLELRKKRKPAHPSALQQLDGMKWVGHAFFHLRAHTIPRDIHPSVTRPCIVFSRGIEISLRRRHLCRRHPYRLLPQPQLAPPPITNQNRRVRRADHPSECARPIPPPHRSPTKFSSHRHVRASDTGVPRIAQHHRTERDESATSMTLSPKNEKTPVRNEPNRLPRNESSNPHFTLIAGSPTIESRPSTPQDARGLVGFEDRAGALRGAGALPGAGALRGDHTAAAKQNRGQPTDEERANAPSAANGSARRDDAAHQCCDPRQPGSDLEQ